MTDSRITYHRIPDTDNAYEVRQDGHFLGTAWLCTTRLWCAKGASGRSPLETWVTRHEAGCWLEQDGQTEIALRARARDREAAGTTLAQRLKRFRAQKAASV